MKNEKKLIDNQKNDENIKDEINGNIHKTNKADKDQGPWLIRFIKKMHTSATKPYPGAKAVFEQEKKKFKHRHQQAIQKGRSLMPQTIKKFVKDISAPDYEGLRSQVDFKSNENLDTVIKVNNLTKDFGFGRGIFNVSFEIKRGEVFGFLGPNGAGKTSTIRHLMGFTNPDKGKAYINGKDCQNDHHEILANVGYLPGEVALPEGLSGWDFLRMMQKMKGVKNDERLNYLLQKFELDPAGSTKRMSLGVKRKLAIVAAFLHDPDILILDEPTSGLDPVMQERFIEFLNEEKKRGKTILLSSHIFGEIDAVCERIAIIKKGRIVSIVQTDEIRHNQKKTYEITFNLDAELEKFSLEKNIEIFEVDASKRKATVNIEDKNINILIQILSKYAFATFTEKKFTLETYFMHFYKSDTIIGGGLTHE